LAVEVRAPTTGIVIEIKAGPGSQVTTDDELMVIESMKMHIPVTSPSDGVVDAVHVSEGDQVSEDDLVLTLS
jgi:acetyl-CoA carboxylase biotin carboxyl carrier protein